MEVWKKLINFKQWALFFDEFQASCLKDAQFRSGFWQRSSRCACVLCQTPTVWGICEDCQRLLPPAPRTVPRLPAGRVFAALRYAWPIDRVLQNFKFAGKMHAAVPLAAFLAARLSDNRRFSPSLTEDPPVLLPIPLAPSRFAQRGFNQSAELAKVLSRALRLPLDLQLLQRHEAPKIGGQARLSFAARRARLDEAFYCASQKVPPKIILIDDIVTTGATLQSAARLLHQHGALSVDAWVLARSGDALFFPKKSNKVNLKPLSKN